MKGPGKQMNGIDMALWIKYIITGVSIGLLWPLSLCLSNEAAGLGRIVAEDDRFIHYSVGIVVDKRDNRMWAQADNREQISIQDAMIYAENSQLGGFTDWRLPDIRELESLMVYYQKNTTEPGDSCSGNYVIHPFFALTCCCPWALQDNGTRPASYPFIKGIATGTSWHHRSHTMGNRVLPVRGMN